MSSNQNSLNNSSHNYSPNQSTGIKRRCRSAQGRTELKNNLLGQVEDGKETTIEGTLMPENFGKSTKKFIEMRTGEALYIKETGEAFYQKSKTDVLVLVNDFK
jgi:hypothetical protein